jgi:hypothetical protein
MNLLLNTIKKMIILLTAMGIFELYELIMDVDETF